MISERGGKIRGLGLVKRGRELPKKSLFQRRTSGVWSANSEEEVCGNLLDGFVFATMEFFLNDGDPFINIMVD